MSTFQRAVAVSGLAALALAMAATAASAHVTANPNTAEPGSYGKVSFRVPNEEQEPEHPAPTVRLVKAAAAGAPAVMPKKASVSSSDGTARLLGGLGLTAGIVGVAVGKYGLTRKRAS